MITKAWKEFCHTAKVNWLPVGAQPAKPSISHSILSQATYRVLLRVALKICIKFCVLLKLYTFYLDDHETLF